MCAVSFANAQNPAERYVNNSVLKSGKWVKISIPKTGIYKLTYEDLSSMGISSPENVRIFGYGGALLREYYDTINEPFPYIDDLPEVAIYMNKGGDNKFNAGDYVLFYGQGTVSWTYNTPPGYSSKMFYHTLNYYANEAYYFVTSDAGTGKRVILKDAETETTGNDITSFTYYDAHEVDLVNLASGGREFYGEEFNAQNISRTFTFNTPNVLAQRMRMRVTAANKANVQATLNLTLNGANVGNVTMDAISQYDNAMNKQTFFSYTPQAANQLEFTLTYSNPNATAYLNFLEFNAVRSLRIDKNEFYFRNVDKLGLNQVNRFVVTGAGGTTQIWDITDKSNIEQLPVIRPNNETINFLAKTNELHEYLAVNVNASFPKPTIVGTIPNQNLHALPQTDFVIISPSEFIGEAERLAEAHRQIDGIRVTVVDAQKIYNEFSSGTPDGTAYRMLMKMFYDRGLQNNDLPQSLLLFGDGSYDNRALLNNTSNNIRRLLTYQNTNSTNTINAYTCDDYFGYMQDGDGGSTSTTSNLVAAQKMSIGVGRLPVYKLEQAKTVVDKTISYMENALRGIWKNRVLFLGDDEDKNEHVNYVDNVAKITEQQNPDILIRKLYLDAYKQETTAAGQRYPMVNTLLDNYIQQGILMVNYMGHGSPNAWTSEQVMTASKILNMANDKYPLFVTATCDFTCFDQFYDSGGEQFLWNKTGGTMALVSTVRTVYSAPNAKLNNYFAKSVFERDENDNPITLGEAVKRAKNQQTDSSNKFAFALLGDPALKLVYPHEGKVATDSINHFAINSAVLDTLSALDEVTLAGHIETKLGDLITSFNGIVYVQVFDKIDTITTLCNDCTGTDTAFRYLDRPNAIYSGSARVENGKFQFSFMVPKDIRYNFGTGRIVYYATEDNLGMEANGNIEGFIIGGESSNYIAENKGPDVTLYMNVPEFRNGGKVNSSPLFVANVYDESGINTIGNGIGHDIVMKLYQQKNNEYVLLQELIVNDYYTSFLGSYKEGRVEYLLRDLEVGKYKIWFRVWDLQNNSTTDEISFEVSKDIKIGVETDYYYDPEIGEVTFVIDHNRPYKPLEITANVYDVAGRHLWTSARNVVTSGTHTEIKWNFKGEGMTSIQGIYLVRIEIAAKDEKSAFIPLKLIITK
jgi:hypothetical protein